MKVVMISLFLVKLISSQELRFPEEFYSQPSLYQTEQIFGGPINNDDRIQARNVPVSENIKEDDSESRTSHKFRPRRVLKKVKKFLRKNHLLRTINPELDKNTEENQTDKTEDNTDRNIQSLLNEVVINSDWDDDGFSKINITDFYDTVNPVELLETLLAQRENIDLQIQHIMQLRNAERKLRGQSILKEPNFTICGKVQTQNIILNGNELPKKPIVVEFNGDSGAQVLLNRLVGVKMDCSCSFGRQTAVTLN